jgi:hypothetical protein
VKYLRRRDYVSFVIHTSQDEHSSVRKYGRGVSEARKSELSIELGEIPREKIFD